MFATKPETCTEMHQVFISKQLHSCQPLLDHLRGEQSSHIFYIGGDGPQEGSLPNSFSCGLRLHGWLSTGSLPLGLAAEAQFMCPSSLILLHRFLLSLWYHVASLWLEAFSAACFCMRCVEAGLCEQSTLGTSMLENSGK